MTKTTAIELITQTALDYFEERMLELTAAGEGAEDGADRRLEIEVEDVREDIASVTVRSAVYHEFLHLARTADGWKIANALWRYT